MASLDKIGTTATTVKVMEGTTRITYHSTTVVEFDDKTITLRTGGWRTATTKTRMNQASRQFDLGFSVRQKRGDWFVDYDGCTFEFDGDEFTIKRR